MGGENGRPFPQCLQHVCMLSNFSCVWLFVTQWTIACQASLSMGFSRQEYWRGLPCFPPWDLPNPQMEPMSLISPALAVRFCSQYEENYCFSVNINHLYIKVYIRNKVNITIILGLDYPRQNWMSFCFCPSLNKIVLVNLKVILSVLPKISLDFLEQ